MRYCSWQRAAIRFWEASAIPATRTRNIVVVRVLTNVHNAGHTGGYELSVFQVSRELARRGHSVEILFVENKGLADEYGRFCERAIRVPGVDFDPDPIRHPRQQMWRTIAIWEGLRSRPDVIYAQRNASAGWAVPLKQITRKPLVMHFRGFADEFTPRQLAKRVKVYNDVADRLIAVSAFVGNQWTSAGLDPKKVEVIHNGIDPDDYPFGDAAARSRARAALGLDDTLFVVTFIGRVDVEKGVEVLLQAWKELDVGPEEGCLLVVGSPITHENPGLYLSELQHGASASVRFIPMQRDVITPLHAADVVVVPSLVEPFGRSVIEGLATGRPVVASRVGGIPEILTGQLAGLLFDSGAAQDLAKRLDGLVGWQNATPDLGLGCREHVERDFTLRRTVDQLEGVFDSLVAG